MHEPHPLEPICRSHQEREQLGEIRHLCASAFSYLYIFLSKKIRDVRMLVFIIVSVIFSSSKDVLLHFDPLWISNPSTCREL